MAEPRTIHWPHLAALALIGASIAISSGLLAAAVAFAAHRWAWLGWVL